MEVCNNLSNTKFSKQGFSIASIPVSSDKINAYDKMVAKQAEEKNKYELLKHYKSAESGVPMKFWNSSVNDFKVTTDSEMHCADKVREFISDVKTGKCNKLLMMCGGFGTGKTLLGSSIIRECGGYYVTSFRLCIEYESSSDFKSKRSKVELFDYYSLIPVLVIDELGTSDKAVTEKELVSNIIDQRYENNLPTVLISNLSKEQIIQLLGKRIFDRLTEICTSIMFTGTSKRKELRIVK